MKVNKNLALLGVVVSLIWEQDEDLHKVEWPGRGEPGQQCYLFCNGDSKKVFLLEPSKVVETEIPIGHQAEKNAYAKWSGFAEIDEAWDLTIPSDKLRKLGEVVEVRYDSDKWEGKWTRYYHRYERYPMVALYSDNRKSPKAWGIKDTKNRKLVSYRGLIR